MPPYVLGLDGGQSSTICVLGTADGTLLSSGRGGPANHIQQPGGPERLRRGLTSAIEGCLAPVQPPVQRLAAAYLSLTGGAQLAMEYMPAIVPVDRVLAESDAVAALACGTSGGPGIGLIAGTGAVALAESAAGTRCWRGGWGYLLGDEGSGYWIGLQALRAAARAEDGRGPPTPLHEQVVQHCGPGPLRAIAARIYGEQIGRPEVARLAPLVLAGAEAGDPVAAAIVEEAAEQLTLLVEATAAAATFTEQRERVIVATGGVLRPGNALWRRFARRVAERLPDFRLIAPRFPPVIGAFLLALRLAGTPVDDAVLARIEASLATVPGIDNKGPHAALPSSP
jgi:N-acetylglucosamine kinase-like BadF-type ATPase